MSEGGHNVFYLFWIKQKRQNKEVIAIKEKVTGKERIL